MRNSEEEEREQVIVPEELVEYIASKTKLDKNLVRRILKAERDYYLSSS